MKVLFIATGGTIDKDYPRSTGGYAFEFNGTAVERALAEMKISLDYRIVVPFQKDSQDITDMDREAIYSAIVGAEERRVVITHGTDTMLATAEYLAGREALEKRTIVLTGALKPERFRDSDAVFNIGVAVGAVESLEPGVYIAMSGLVLPWYRCARADDGRFVEG